jgi:Glutaminase
MRQLGQFGSGSIPHPQPQLSSAYLRPASKTLECVPGVPRLAPRTSLLDSCSRSSRSMQDAPDVHDPHNNTSSHAIEPLLGSQLQKTVDAIYTKYKDVDDGAVATYIPELGKANPRDFGICLATTEGQVFTAIGTRNSPSNPCASPSRSRWRLSNTASKRH